MPYRSHMIFKTAISVYEQLFETSDILSADIALNCGGHSVCYLVTTRKYTPVYKLV